MRAIAMAKEIGPVTRGTELKLSIVLPLRNQPELADLLTRLYDPSDRQYGRYLSAGEFTARFGPSREDYDIVAAYAEARGFLVTGRHPNRTILNLSGPVQAVEATFGVHLYRYLKTDGREFYAPDRDPQLPDYIAARVSGIVGLDSAVVWRKHSRAAEADSSRRSSLAVESPPASLTPAAILTAYNLNGVAATGSGQTLGLFELDGYDPADIAAYESYYGLPSVPLQNVYVDKVSGAAGDGSDEVTLDIELQAAVAPGTDHIIVYEGPNTAVGILDTYNAIANDNLAKQISTSWGLSEDQAGQAILDGENAIFQQMAAQGQSIYAASGDSGAYDDGQALSVDDPASQPYMVGTGGTTLSVNADGTYGGESTWNKGPSEAGGGGVSSIWPAPPWQAGVVSKDSLGSVTQRNVPDVSLNADPYPGYSVYLRGAWYVYGGTSCAAPLWAGLTARINQVRAKHGIALMGFPSPALYRLGQESGYKMTFHDIDDGSTNGYYPAVTGYDDATGWGSFNGAELIAALSPPASPFNVTAVGGDRSVTLTWADQGGLNSYTVYRATQAGREGATPVASGIMSATYRDAPLTNGTTYYYRVAAANGSGTSAYSNEVSATPGSSRLPRRPDGVDLQQRFQEGATPKSVPH